MRLEPAPIAGLHVVEPERLADERGTFARSFDAAVFAAAGFGPVVQCSASVSRRAGMLRGMHFQRGPHAEGKLVRCVRGAVFDAVVDLRPDSPTRLQWYGAELSAKNGRALLVPKGLAHGFLTLSDDCELLYMMDAVYVAGAADGIRWDDPAVGIEWPLADGQIPEMVERDAGYPDLSA